MAPVVLIISPSWWRCEDPVSMTARKVAQSLAAKGARVFCTCSHPISEISEDIKRDAELHNIEAFVCGFSREHKDPSSIEWICKYPEKYYKYLFTEKHHFDAISEIIAFAPLTAKTAFEVQMDLYRAYGRKPAVHLINHRCIEEESEEYMDIYELIKDWVSQHGATTIWSLGPKMYDFYARLYGSLNVSEKLEHKLLLLSPEETGFTLKQTVSSKTVRLLSIVQEVLTYPSHSSVLDHDETAEHYRVMAEAMANMNALLKYSQTSKITWVVSDSDDKLAKSLKDTYKDVTFQRRVLYSCPERLRQQLQQSQFFVAPDTDSSFDMMAWLALGSGLPTLVTSESAVGQTLLMLFEKHNNITFKYFLIEEEEDSTLWRDKLVDLISNRTSTVTTAETLKSLLLASDYIKQLQNDFVETICHRLQITGGMGQHVLQEHGGLALTQSPRRSPVTIFPGTKSSEIVSSELPSASPYLKGSAPVPIKIVSVKDCSQYDGAMATVVSDGIQSRGALDEGLPSQLQPSRQPAAHSEPVSAEGDHGDDLTVEQEAQQIQEDIAKSKTREGRQWEKREGENEAPPNEMQVKPEEMRTLIPMPSSSHMFVHDLNPNFRVLRDEMNEVLQRIRESQQKCQKRLDPVIVAVLDSGICSKHRDLMGMVIENKCFVPQLVDKVDQNIDLIEDKANHGTMVAGILWQYAPFVKMLNLKVLSHDRTGSLNSVVKALEYIKTWDISNRQNLKVDIINMSLGDERENRDLDRLLAELSLEKVIVCAAANGGRMTENTILNPANSGNCICVGSHDTHGDKCPHSSVGQQLDFLCPGNDIRSTASHAFAESIGAIDEKPLYIQSSGTSFASPHASAVAAVVLALTQVELDTLTPTSPEDRIVAQLAPEQLANHWRQELTRTKTMRKILHKMGTDSHDRHRGHGILHPKTVLENKYTFASYVMKVLGLKNYEM